MNRWRRACKNLILFLNQILLWMGSAFALGHEVLQRIFPFPGFGQGLSCELRCGWSAGLRGRRPEAIEPEDTGDVIGENRDSLEYRITACPMYQQPEKDG